VIKNLRIDSTNLHILNNFESFSNLQFSKKVTADEFKKALESLQSLSCLEQLSTELSSTVKKMKEPQEIIAFSLKLTPLSHLFHLSDLSNVLNILMQLSWATTVSLLGTTPQPKFVQSMTETMDTLQLLITPKQSHTLPVHPDGKINKFMKNINTVSQIDHNSISTTQMESIWDQITDFGKFKAELNSPNPTETSQLKFLVECLNKLKSLPHKDESTHSILFEGLLQSLLTKLFEDLKQISLLSKISTSGTKETALSNCELFVNQMNPQQHQEFKKAFANLHHLSDLSTLPIIFTQQNFTKVQTALYKLPKSDTKSAPNTQQPPASNNTSPRPGLLAASLPHYELYCQYTSKLCQKHSFGGFLCGLLHVDTQHVDPQNGTLAHINHFQIPAQCSDGAHCFKSNCNSKHEYSSESSCQKSDCKMAHTRICPELQQNAQCSGFLLSRSLDSHQKCNFQHICTKFDCPDRTANSVPPGLIPPNDPNSIIPPSPECKFLHLCAVKGCNESRHYHLQNSTCIHSELSCPLLRMCIPHQHDYNSGSKNSHDEQYWGDNIYDDK
jgi:hypothetical protein